MNYNKKILYFIQIIDKVLSFCNQKKLLENDDFVIANNFLPRSLFSIGNAYHKVNQQRDLVWCFEVMYALHIEDV